MGADQRLVPQLVHRDTGPYSEAVLRIIGDPSQPGDPFDINDRLGRDELFAQLDDHVCAAVEQLALRFKPVQQIKRLLQGSRGVIFKCFHPIPSFRRDTGRSCAGPANALRAPKLSRWATRPLSRVRSPR